MTKPIVKLFWPSGC